MVARLSISRVVSRLADADPDRVVLVTAEETLTARELDRRSNRYARHLLAHGVARDDLVTVSLPNGAAMVVVCVAIWKAGATPQPVSPGRTPQELAAVVRVARPAVTVGCAVEGVPALGTVPGDELDDGPLPDTWARAWKAPTSSGSTGAPKVVVAAAPALLDPDVPVAAFLPLAATQLVSGPLTHSASFTYAFRGLLTGHRLVVLPRFDAHAWLDAVERHRVTWATLVPTTMHRLLRLPAEQRDVSRLTSLETVLHLGSPCAPDLKERFLDWLGPERVVEVYAGSESNGLSMIRGDEWLRHRGSVGRPVGGTQVRVLRDDGTPARPGETGLVWLRRGDSPTYRYLGTPGRRTADGWDTLGDLGHVDADGYLWITDRDDDVIVRGGERVHPVEVERVLERHPAVRSAAAYGVPDEEYGQHVEAVADVGSADVDGATLRAFAAAHLDAPRRPTVVHVVRVPVRDDAGKVRRRDLAARHFRG
ncbi:AMP-binding protein [Cellulomonas dongxiuzhuiae]|uniref:AMP-binding protein n=1 Tax=Cellulomonas dongxiuzhuiae TaxID=2819979 RepID=UPI001AAF8AF8|nr:AMP-binding protein [Cellulomonas dongxiuzhuiae]MBO3087142.1 AMP-binding protein [Cellulomonas dongxiuzhuiae]